MKTPRSAILGVCAALITAMLASTPTAQASELSEIRAQQRELDGQIREQREAERELRDTIRKLEAGRRIEGDDETYSGNCDSACRPGSSACELSTFETLGIAAHLNRPLPSREQRPCNLLYSRDMDFERIPAACAAAVSQCGDVKRKIRVKTLKADLLVVQAEIRELSAEKRKLTAAYVEAQRACPQCEMLEAMKPRDPKLGDYIIGGIQALTPLGLGLINSSMYSKGMNRYYGSYDNYLEQCVTIGVPCGAPGMYMGSAGGFGYGGGGSMWGSLGAGLLSGLLGGGGVGFNIGVGAGGGYPYGMGGYGMWGSPWGGLGANVGLNAGVGLSAMPGMAYMGMNPYAMMSMNPYAGIYANMGMNPYAMMGMNNPYGGAGIYAGINLGTNGGMGPYGGYPWWMNGNGGIATPGWNPYANSPFGWNNGMNTGWNPYANGGINAGFNTGWNPYANGGIATPGWNPYANSPFGWNNGMNTGYNANWQAQAQYQQYYAAMMQAQMQSQMLQAQRAQQAQQNIMISQQQLYEAQMRYQQVASQYSSYVSGGYGGYGYGGYGYGLPSVGGGLTIGIGAGVGVGGGFGVGMSAGSGHGF